MAQPRSMPQREAHRRAIARAAVERPTATTRELAAELGIDHSTVVRDRQALLREWRRERLRDADAHVDLALAVERAIQDEAWQGWERSTADRETRRAVQGHGGAADTTRYELTTETRPGNPDFLEAIGRSNQLVIDLLGLAEPVRVNLGAAVAADVDALADPDWLGPFIEALGRVRYGTPTEEAAAAPPARPALLSLAPDDALAGVPA